MAISSGPQNFNFPINRANAHQTHTNGVSKQNKPSEQPKTFLTDEDASKAPHDSHTDIQDINTNLPDDDSNDSDLPDNDSDTQQVVDNTIISATTTSTSNSTAIPISSLDLPFEGIINPFRVLGFYKEVDTDIYFQPVYRRKQKYFDGVLYGLKINPNYCDYSDLYNLFNSTNIFDHMHFVAEYPTDSNFERAGLCLTDSSTKQPIRLAQTRCDGKDWS